MGRIYAIARHTVSEGIRMNVALVFMGIVLCIVVGLPFSVQSEESVSSSVQSFLSISIRLVSLILLLLTVFLSRSLSDEMVQKQILILIAKPIPRWQYVIGKWLGIVALNAVLLTFAGVGIYAAVQVMAGMAPRNEFDERRLKDEVLVARHATSFKMPNFAAFASAQFEKRREEGFYATLPDANTEKKRMTMEAESRWRTIVPMEGRVFDFENIRCVRGKDTFLQIRYKAIVYNYPPDEVLRCEWEIGDPDKGTALYHRSRRDVINRHHVINVPTDAVAADHTLQVKLLNRNPFPTEPQFHNVITFATNDDVQVLFTVGTFGGNLLRLLAMTFCKLMLVAAISILCVCVFSFPVACLVTFSFLILASMSGYLGDAIQWFYDEEVLGILRQLSRFVYTVCYMVVPDFSKYDGTDLLVNGRNVTLRWVLDAAATLVFIYTTVILLIACILFQRREVAEVSV